MFIKQISVFLENRPGTLRELTALLGGGGIDIREISIADTQSFGIVRMLVSEQQIDSAMELLQAGGYMCRINHVICAEVDDTPGGLSKLLEVIEKEALSVEYMYSCRRTERGNALMVLRLSEQDRGCRVLKASGVRVRSQEEVDGINYKEEK